MSEAVPTPSHFGGEFPAMHAAPGYDGVVYLSGELDMTAGPVLETAEADAPPGPLIIDLADINFADTMGISALLRIRNRRGGEQQSVVLRHLHPQVRTLLNLTSLDALFSLEP